MASSSLYDVLKPVVDTILNNWTALQLAVEHGMGGQNGKQKAQDLSDYITGIFCENEVLDTDDILDILEDIMDEQFNTICEDNSPKEIAELLIKFLVLCKQGDLTQLNTQIAQLPKCNLWLCKPQSGTKTQDEESESSDDEEAPELVNGNSEPSKQNQEEPMDEDVEPGWTVIRTKRK